MDSPVVLGAWSLSQVSFLRILRSLECLSARAMTCRGPFAPLIIAKYSARHRQAVHQRSTSRQDRDEDTAELFYVFRESRGVPRRQPADAQDLPMRGFAAGIGIVKGQRFSPDAETRTLLAAGASTASNMGARLRYERRNKLP